MRVVANFLTESWDEDPEARLTAANVLVQLENLVQTRTNTLESSQQESALSSGGLGGQVSENSQSSLCKKVRVSASFSCSSGVAQSFVSPPVRTSVDHIATCTNIDLAALQRDNTLIRIDSSSSQPHSDEPPLSTTTAISIPSPAVNIDATTGQQQQSSPTDNQCCTVIISDSITHDDD